MQEISMDKIYLFVATFTGTTHIKPGDPIPLLTDCDTELHLLHEQYDEAFRHMAPDGKTEKEWDQMFKELKMEYAPRYQAWADKYKQGFKFSTDGSTTEEKQ